MKMKNSDFMKQILAEIIIAAKLSPRIYFAPIFGAVRGIKHEYSKLLGRGNDE